MAYASPDLVLYIAAIARLRESERYGHGEAFDRWLDSPEGVETVRRIVNHEADPPEPSS